MEHSIASSADDQATDAPPYDPPPVRPRRLGARDAHRLLGALAVLTDYERAIKGALETTHGDESDHARLCRALRFLVDAYPGPPRPEASLDEPKTVAR